MMQQSSSMCSFSYVFYCRTLAMKSPSLNSGSFSGTLLIVVIFIIKFILGFCCGSQDYPSVNRVNRVASPMNSEAGGTRFAVPFVGGWWNWTGLRLRVPWSHLVISPTRKKVSHMQIFVAWVFREQWCPSLVCSIWCRQQLSCEHHISNTSSEIPKVSVDVRAVNPVISAFPVPYNMK